MQIDCYGFGATSQFFKRRELLAHLVSKEGDGTVYMCFGREGRRPIHRIAKAGPGLWEAGWAWGAWDDRASLEYVPLSETLEVEGEEGA